jgi:uncharacterized protein YdhG (YjbR/CyaY superfamily)
LYAILKSIAPDAREAIKWGTPFFVEPRFVFAFSAFKSHLDFAPDPRALKKFSKELEGHRITKNYLQVPYDEPLPEDLIRKLAEYSLKTVRERDDDAFWYSPTSR